MNKVVLVDDEIYARQGLRCLIDWEGLGYEVTHEANNGEEALQMIQDVKPELVITDIRMPVLDGLELIRAVRESGNTDTKFIIVSGYGDFKYAQQAIKFNVNDFILKPIDEEELNFSLARLAEQIESDKRAKEELSVYPLKSTDRLLRGQADDAEIGAFEKQLGWDASAGLYHCLFVEINANVPEREAGAREERTTEAEGGERQVRAADRHSTETTDKQHHLLIARTAAEMGLSNQPIQALEYKPGVYALLAHVGAMAFGRLGLAETADRLARRLSDRLVKPVMIYAGEGVPELARIGDAYRTACSVMDYKYAFAGRNVLVYEEIGSLELRYEEFTPADYARLLEQMEEGQREEMLATVDWLFEQLQEKRFAPEAVQNAIARIAFGVIGTIRSMQGDENDIRSLEPILQWRKQPITLHGLKELFRAFVTESAEMAAKLRKQNAKGDIVKIKSYIEQHYNEDISLKSIAAKFYMNPVYLGQLFKKTYGMYFNDFLLQLRILNAKRLLRQTEMRVYEIARTVGFDNSDYFVSKFEKVEGRTPTAYRNEILAK